MSVKTLAQFVQQTRENLGLNAKGLAKKMQPRFDCD